MVIEFGKMEKLLLIFMFLLLPLFKGFCKCNNCQVDSGNIGTLSEELNKFTSSINKKYPKICRYFVYVIYVYPLNDEKECRGYTISYVFNFDELNNIVDPQYYVLDTTNLIVVSFSPLIKNDSIQGLKLNKLVDKRIIRNKLLQEKDGFITGINEALTYNDCPQKKEKTYYENSDYMKPKSQLLISIFRLE